MKLTLPHIVKNYLNKRPTLKQLTKFGTVGAICVLVDFAIVYTLFELFGMNKYVANISSTIVGVIVNYILNRKWTFRSKEPWKKEFIRFVSISLFGVLFNNLIVFFGNDTMFDLLNFFCTNYNNQLHFWFCDDTLRWAFYGIKITAIVIVFFWNFYINRKFNFKKK